MTEQKMMNPVPASHSGAHIGTAIPNQTANLVTKTKIGSTTYIVSSTFKADNKDTAVTKMARVIENEMRLKNRPCQQNN